MPINELSPAFTIGFAVKDMENFKMLTFYTLSLYLCLLFLYKSNVDEKIN